MLSEDGSITKHNLGDVLSSPSLRAQIENIAAQNYDNPDVLLGQEFKRNNEVFLYTELGEIYGFFMVGRSTLKPEPEQTIFSVYLGLSSVSPRRQGLGIGGRLYRAFLFEGKRWAKDHRNRLHWWFFTASFIAARSWWKLAPSINPRPDGSYTEEAKAYLSLIQSEYGLTPYRDPEYPFVVRGYALARYAIDEHTRLTALQIQHTTDLLSQLRIDERKGDRMIFVGSIDPE